MQPRERASFDADELAIVLSHYDLGVIATITDFPRGSRQSPKAGLVTERGKFVIKRRTLDHRRVERVRFAHGVQQHLLQHGFPIARVIPTRDDHGFLYLHQHLYEVFEFAPGNTYEASATETQDAGQRLAQFHASTASYEPPPGVLRPRGDYHNAQAVCAALGAMGSTLRSHDSFAGNEAELAGLTVFLLDWYERAAEVVNRAIPQGEEDRIVHSDWHPGNLLFRNGRVLAVVDFDAVRYARRVAVSESKLLEVTEHKVIFKTKHGMTATLTPADFTRRFLLHVLPLGFTKLRHYGLYAAANAKRKLPEARAALALLRGVDVAAPSAVTDTLEILSRLMGRDASICPKCGSKLLPLVRVRGPPFGGVCAA